MNIIDKVILEEEERELGGQNTNNIVDNIIAKTIQEERQVLPSEIISDTSRDADFFTILGGGVPTDKRAAVRYFANKRGIPIDRYRIVDNEIVYQADDGKFYQEVPEFEDNPLFASAYYAPDVVEAIPGVVSGILSLPLSPAASVSLAAGVDAGANAVRQGIASLLADQEFDPKETVISGALGGAAQMAPYAYKGFMNRNLARDIELVDEVEQLNLEKLAKEYNIDLTPAEKTFLPSLEQMQKIVGQVDEGSDIMRKFYLKRYGDMQEAIDEYLSTIARAEDSSVVGSQAQQALTDEVERLKNIRAEKTEPLYTASYANATAIPKAKVQSVVKKIDDALRYAKGPHKTMLKQLKGTMFIETIVDGKAVKQLDVSLQGLHEARMAMDAMFNTDPNVQGLAAKQMASLTSIRDKLSNVLQKENPEFAQADATFAKLSQPIDEFRQTPAGVSLVKISPANVQNFSDRIFKNTTPAMIKRAKTQIEKNNPEAWNLLVRDFMEKRFDEAIGSAKKAKDVEVDFGLTWSNLLMGDKKKRAILKAALTGEQYNSLNNLGAVLRAAGRVKKMGSDTFQNQEATRQLKEGGLTIAGNAASILAKGVSVPLWGNYISEFLQERSWRKNAKAWANIITDKNAMEKLKQLKRVGKRSPQFVAGLVQFLDEFIDQGLLRDDNPELPME